MWAPVPLPASQGDWSIAKGGAACYKRRYEAGPIGLPTIAGTGEVTRWGGAVGVGLNTALLRIGRQLLNTIICS